MRPELERLPQGWFHHGEKILDLVDQHRPLVTVELGTWKGASAIALARLVRTWGGVIYCIDTWAGQVNGSKAGTIPGKPAMLVECATNLLAAGVAPAVRLIPTRTDAAASLWSIPIDFLYVDADHAKPSVRSDLDLWWPHLKVGGLVAGDDYDNPMYPGVREAWDEFEQAQGQRFERFATPNTNPPGMRLVYGVKDDGRLR
jgi:predicted O-methyltransferase YrrM